MSLPDTEAMARAALKTRLGRGARFDAPRAPAAELLLARRGAAYFARQLNALSDGDLSGPSLQDGSSRSQLIAHVSYQARGMAIALKAVRAALTREEVEWRPDVNLAATLPARALRALYAHSDVHLNVEFRDLTDADWAKTCAAGVGETLLVRDAPAFRARVIWRAAYLLGPVHRLADVPPQILGDGKMNLG